MYGVNLVHPSWQWCAGQGFARSDVFGDPASDFFPTGGLPRFERTFVPAKAPTNGEIDVACVVSNAFQMHGDVVEYVTEDRPQELRLRMIGFAQQFEALCRWFFQDARDQFVGFRATGHVFAFGCIQNFDFFTFFAVETCAGFLTQSTFFNQDFQHRRHRVVGRKRIVFEVVFHGFDDVRHGVQTDHVGGTEGR